MENPVPSKIVPERKKKAFSFSLNIHHIDERPQNLKAFSMDDKTRSPDVELSPPTTKTRAPLSKQKSSFSSSLSSFAGKFNSSRSSTAKNGFQEKKAKSLTITALSSKTKEERAQQKAVYGSVPLEFLLNRQTTNKPQSAKLPKTRSVEIQVRNLETLSADNVLFRS
eukprot:c19485_g1_i1.p1 GENE.c19485_g1_i1~~c19485_g1_i1.p1  ORF type:complete len:167 (-),score=40.32 c19485_g1_i1:22-522(-)